MISPNRFNLIFTDHIWKPIRKNINAAFSHRSSLALIPLFNKHANNYRTELDGLVQNGKDFDMYDVCVKVTIAQLLESTIRQQTIETRFDRTIIENWAEAITKRAVNPIYYPYKVFQYSHLYQPYKKGHEHLCEIWSSAIMRANNNLFEENNNGYSRVLIDELMKLAKEGNGFNFKLVHDNLTSVLSVRREWMTFSNKIYFRVYFFQGFETISLTISYTILMLAMHPEVDKKLELELFEHYKPGEAVDYDLLKRLEYLDRVLKESMRLFPASPISPRESVASINVNGIGLIPKGTIAVIPFHKLHRWKHIWGENADQFDPENFRPHAVTQRHAYSYLPFSSGSRNCIGE